MIHLLPGSAEPEVAAPRTRPSSFVALGIFTLITLAMAWPVTRDLTTSVPSDYGDPLFVQWVMGWIARHLSVAAQGQISALDRLWNANIFYPEPGTLAFSEHFVAQTVMVLPVYWLTGNLIACYNIALLASFVLTGLGTFLLARDLWGRIVAALAAGLFAAFNEYRLVYELGHLHVLTIQWLPFAMLGVHRYIAYGTPAALWGAGLAIVALNLSAGYYLAYATPFIVAFALVELVRTGRLGHWGSWAGLITAGVSAAMVTLPFIWPYVRMQERLGFVRPIAEVVAFSATLDHYAAALPGLAIPLALAGVALIAIVSPAPLTARDHAAAGETVRGEWRFRPGARNPPRQALAIVALFLFLLLAFWLSLGPSVRYHGEVLSVPALYNLLYTHVPGFTGLRAASRYGAVFLVFLPLLAGAGAAYLERRIGFAGRLALVFGLFVYLWQAWPATFPVNTILPPPAPLVAPPPYLKPMPTSPPIYTAVGGLDREAILVELPFGDPWYELRYMFFAATHGRRMLNGYSGLFPPSYVARQRALAAPLASPEAAFRALAPATHAVVHAQAWGDDTGERLVGWLEEQGAQLVDSQDRAYLLALDPVLRNAGTDGR